MRIIIAGSRDLMIIVVSKNVQNSLKEMADDLKLE